MYELMQLTAKSLVDYSKVRNDEEFNAIATGLKQYI